jgi:hypothetical protein
MSDLESSVQLLLGEGSRDRLLETYASEVSFTFVATLVAFFPISDRNSGSLMG